MNDIDKTAPQNEAPQTEAPETAKTETPADDAAPAEVISEIQFGPDADGETVDADQADQAEAEPEDETEVLRAEAVELRGDLLRALAETENVRRRARREREDVGKYAISNFARDLLSVADNLRRALDSVPETARADETLSGMLDGVEMTEREFLAVFERHGIRRIEPKGEKFDHNFHQAMFEVETTDEPAGTVVEVMQPGYAIAERLLRPAMVGVARAPKGDAGPAADGAA
jgi:molecular chaperone GrpE